jgi:REP element-mobilizing transposase RayT
MSPQFQRLDDLGAPAIDERNLPHWKTAGATYFVTFRTADSLPSGVLRQIEARLRAWLRAHGLKSSEELGTLSAAQQFDYRKTVNEQEEQALNAGYGTCPFREARHREVLDALLRGHDGALYLLDEFVIMPNHVHVLVLPARDSSLSSITGSWKKHSARLVNASLGRSGKLWQAESFDHIVRTAQQLRQYRRYIAGNPVEAGLGAGEFLLGRGSGILL